MEFEGKTKEEAIDLACKALKTDERNLNIEVIEDKKVGIFFKKRLVKIKVSFKKEKNSVILSNTRVEENLKDLEDRYLEMEKEVFDFISRLYKGLDLDVKCNVIKRTEHEIFISIESSNPSLVIGKNGINIDSVQFLSNIVANKFINSNIKIILDSGSFRKNKINYYKNFISKVAKDIRKSKKSVTIPKVSPYERKFIYSMIAKEKEVHVKGIGDDSYKDLKIYYSKKKE